MNWLSRLRRAPSSLALATAGRRWRAIVALIALPLAAAFVAGTALGVGAERGGWGLIAIAVAVPVSLMAAAIAGIGLLRGVQSVRRVHRAFWITEKIEPLHVAVSDAAPARVDVVHPAVDLKHFFGGFIAVFNLARRLTERGHRVRLIALEGAELPRDWRRRLAAYEGIGKSLDALEITFAADGTRPVELNRDDALIATHWTAAHVAAGALPHLHTDRFLYLIQEYEPFIFPMGSAAALARASYELPHTALFSSELLRDWFAEHAIGVFADGRAAGHQSSVSFANAITPVGPVTPDELRRRGPKRILFYARPEEHATRNLFELGAMALDQSITAGGFAGWDLAGAGTVELGRGTIPLPRSGASLRIIPRRSQSDYAQLLRSSDVGLALMHTPHPSLVPIEMAAAGMATVTSTFDNKDSAALARISANLIAAKPSVQEIAAALAVAEARSDDLDERARQSRVRWPTNWDDALSDELMAEVERLAGIGAREPASA